MALNKLVVILAFHTYLARVVSKEKSEASMDQNELKKAKRINKIGKIASAISFTVFMIIFWSTALQHYGKPAKDYL